MNEAHARAALRIRYPKGSIWLHDYAGITWIVKLTRISTITGEWRGVIQGNQGTVNDQARCWGMLSELRECSQGGLKDQGKHNKALLQRYERALRLITGIMVVDGLCSGLAVSLAKEALDAKSH